MIPWPKTRGNLMGMKPDLPRLHAAATVTCLLAALPAAAQESPLPDLFSDVIDVRVVNVEVVVTDRSGNRIRGLQPGDFELHVDGEPVPIDYFTEVDEGRALEASDEGVGNVPALTPDEPVGTSYLVFIDDLFAIKQRRDRVLKRLEEDLVRLGRADRIAVVAHDGHELTLLTDWTGERADMETALLEARERKPYGLLYRHGMGSERGDKTRRSVMAAAGAVRSFANAPGRKVMLLLIEGWATVSDTWNYRSAYAAASAGVTLDRLYGPLVDAANLVGYSLYPIDLPGFQGPPSPPIGGFGEGLAPPFAGSIGGYATWSAMPERRFHNVLQFLAEETGGLPMINSFSKKALAETAEDTRSYYWLGFVPPRNEDDRLHDIAVRLPEHRGLRVRTREHYLDMSKATEVGMLVEGALLLGGSPGAESIEVSFGEPRKAGFRRLDVPMKVTVPLDDVELLPVDGQWANDLEFRIRLINKWGDQAAPPMAKVQVRIPNEPMPGDLYVFETDLTIRKREHRFVAAVYDPLTGDLLSTRGTVGPR
ncbi:MAG: VWA domain-containing protein [Holophagales bacterium]|nr:VWA domain-containing protein [Holophagales bacterium]MYH26407.1 VWA domain-containing protein [Holophagales bacterium]